MNESNVMIKKIDVKESLISPFILFCSVCFMYLHLSTCTLVSFPGKHFLCRCFKIKHRIFRLEIIHRYNDRFRLNTNAWHFFLFLQRDKIMDKIFHFPKNNISNNCKNKIMIVGFCVFNIS